MRVAICLAIALSAFPTTGLAAEPSAPTDGKPLLWKDLRVGMSHAEVKALHPKNLVPLPNGCNIVAYPRFEKKVLHRVDMEWSTKDPAALRCGVLVRQTLFEKYGEPDASEREMKLNDCGNPYAKGLAGALAGLCEGMGGDEPDYYEISRWVRDGVEITFKVDAKADDPQWWAVYRAAPVADESMKDAF